MNTLILHDPFSPSLEHNQRSTFLLTITTTETVCALTTHAQERNADCDPSAAANMVHLPQVVLSLLSFTLWQWPESLPTLEGSAIQAPAPLIPTHSNVTKSIAIVGAGSAGLAVLKTLMELPEEVRSTWRIVCYEQRRDVGGVWLPDLNHPHPPALPETPLYPRLRTNTPHPTMTYPGFTFPPDTPLFPSWDYLERYHSDFAEHFNISSYIHFNQTVVAAGWHGNHVSGKWEIEVARTDSPSPSTEREFFDHLIVGNGHNHYPRVPHWDGEEDWLKHSSPGGLKRQLMHSIYYRNPEHYANRTVVIVGGGASGRDAALQVGPLTTVSTSLR